MLNNTVHIEDVQNMLAYIHARQGIDKSALHDALEMLMEDNGSWDIGQLVEQIDERGQAIAAAL